MITSNPLRTNITNDVIKENTPVTKPVVKSDPETPKTPAIIGNGKINESDNINIPSTVSTSEVDETVSKIKDKVENGEVKGSFYDKVGEFAQTNLDGNISLVEEAKSSIGTDIARIDNQLLNIDNSIEVLKKEAENAPESDKENILKSVSDLENGKASLLNVKGALEAFKAGKPINEVNLLLDKALNQFPDASGEISNLKNNLTLISNSTNNVNKIISSSSSSLSKISIDFKYTQLNIAPFTLGDNHKKAADKIGTQIASIDKQLTSIDTENKSIDEALKTVTDPMARKELENNKGKLQEQKEYLNGVKEVLKVEKEIHLVMATDNKGKVNNSEEIEASPEKIEKLYTLSQQLEQSIKNVPDPSNLSKETQAFNEKFVKRSQETQKFASDISEIAGNSTILSLAQGGTSMARLGQQYMSYHQHALDGNRSGKGETPDVQGFANKLKNDIKYDILCAKKMRELEKSINTGAIKSPEEIKTAVENLFKTQSGKFVIPASKVAQTVQVFQEYGEAVRDYNESKKNASTSSSLANTNINNKQLEELNKHKNLVQKHIADVQEDISKIDGVNLPDISSIGFGSRTTSQLKNTGEKAKDLTEQATATNKGALKEVIAENVEVSREIEEVKENYLKEIKVDKDIKNFDQILSPVNSPGDNVTFTVQAKIGAGVNAFGITFGAEVEANLKLAVSQDNDGWYYLTVESQAGVNAVAKAGRGDAQVGVGAGGGLIETNQVRFKSMADVKEYLKDEVGKFEIFDNLDPVKPYTLPQSVDKTGYYGKAFVNAELFGVKVSGEYKHIDQKVTYSAKGNNIAPKDEKGNLIAGSYTSNSGTISVDIGKVGLVGSFKEFTIKGDPLDNNNGTYRDFDGVVTFELDKTMLKKLEVGDVESFTQDAMKLMEKLDLSKQAKATLVAGLINKAVDGKDLGSITSSLKIGVAYQSESAQQSDGTFKEIYSRVGGTVSMSVEKEFDAAVVWGSLKAELSATDYEDLDIRSYESPAYLQTLYETNFNEYQELMSKQGVKDSEKSTMMYTDGSGKKVSLAELEKGWTKDKYK